MSVGREKKIIDSRSIPPKIESIAFGNRKEKDRGKVKDNGKF